MFLQLKVETDIKLFWILQKCKSTKSISLFWLNFKLWWKCAFVNLVIYSFSNYSTYYYSSSYKINDMICVVFYNNPLDKVDFTPKISMMYSDWCRGSFYARNLLLLTTFKVWKIGSPVQRTICLSKSTKPPQLTIIILYVQKKKKIFAIVIVYCCS